MPKHKTVGGRKSVRIKKTVAKKAKPIYVSDEDIPDETSESFYKDDVDLYHDQREFHLFNCGFLLTVALTGKHC